MLLVWMLSVLGVLLAGSGSGDVERPVRFEGAQVYTANSPGFVARPLVATGGRLADATGVPAADSEVVSLAGMYVLPAFGDAHTHRFTAEDPQATELFLGAGMVYIHNLNGCADSRRRSAKDCNTARTPDVRFANAGFTCTGGHPVVLYTYLDGMNKTNDPATAMSRIGDFNFYITDEPGQIDAKWAKFVATKPDGVKLYLLNSERWSDPQPDKVSTGLRPEIARELGERSRKAGLRVFAHVESAADARVARESGVTLLAHMPGYSVNSDDAQVTAPYLVSDDEMRAAAAAGMALTPTLGLVYADPNNAELVTRVKTWKRVQVTRWRTAGMPILYGSDNYFDNTSELRAMIESSLWTPAELVDMLAVRTPRWIFPDRAVGSLEPGSEATFVVLATNPLEDPRALLSVRAVYKDGVRVWAAPAAAPSPPAVPPGAGKP